jgi:hypothetical protein
VRNHDTAWAERDGPVLVAAGFSALEPRRKPLRYCWCRYAGGRGLAVAPEGVTKMLIRNTRRIGHRPIVVGISISRRMHR